MQNSPSVQLHLEDYADVSISIIKKSSFSNTLLQLSESIVKDNDYFKSQQIKLGPKRLDFTTNNTNQSDHSQYILQQTQFINNFNIFQDEIVQQSFIYQTRNIEQYLKYDEENKKQKICQMQTKREIRQLSKQKIVGNTIKLNVKKIAQYRQQMDLSLLKIVKAKHSLPQVQIQKEIILNPIAINQIKGFSARNYPQRKFQNYSNHSILDPISINTSCLPRIKNSFCINRPNFVHYFTSKATPKDQNIAKHIFFKYCQHEKQINRIQKNAKQSKNKIRQENRAINNICNQQTNHKQRLTKRRRSIRQIKLQPIY